MTFDTSPEVRVGVHILVANHCCASVGLRRVFGPKDIGRRTLALRRYSKAFALHFFTSVSACFIGNLSSRVVVRAVESIASHKDSIFAISSEVGGTNSHGSVHRSVGYSYFGR